MKKEALVVGIILLTMVLPASAVHAAEDDGDGTVVLVPSVLRPTYFKCDWVGGTICSIVGPEIAYEFELPFSSDNPAKNIAMMRFLTGLVDEYGYHDGLMNDPGRLEAFQVVLKDDGVLEEVRENGQVLWAAGEDTVLYPYWLLCDRPGDREWIPRNPSYVNEVKNTLEGTEIQVVGPEVGFEAIYSGSVLQRVALTLVSLRFGVASPILRGDYPEASPQFLVSCQEGQGYPYEEPLRPYVLHAVRNKGEVVWQDGTVEEEEVVVQSSLPITPPVVQTVEVAAVVTATATSPMPARATSYLEVWSDEVVLSEDKTAIIWLDSSRRGTDRGLPLATCSEEDYLVFEKNLAKTEPQRLTLWIREGFIVGLGLSGEVIWQVCSGWPNG